MRDTTGVDRSCTMKCDVLRSYLVKQACSVPEKYGNEVDVQFIEASGLHEVRRSSTLHQAIACAVRNDEYRNMERRIVVVAAAFLARPYPAGERTSEFLRDVTVLEYDFRQGPLPATLRGVKRRKRAFGLIRTRSSRP